MRSRLFFNPESEYGFFNYHRAHRALERGKVIIEIKSVSSLLPIHEAQLLSYLKLSDCKTGLLINFNVKLLKDGIRRVKS